METWKTKKNSNNDLHFSIEKLKASLLDNPGKKVQGHETLPQAAVCVILRSEKGTSEHSVLMIKRRDLENDPWSGHMAFPGGHYVEADRDLLSTAIREVLEEMRLDLRNCSMLGTLDEMLPGNQLIKVTPYVALASEDVEVKINENEVAKFFWIPISFFLDTRNKSTQSLERAGAKLVFPSYLYSDQYVIWGMSYRIFQDLLSKASELG